MRYQNECYAVCDELVRIYEQIRRGTGIRITGKGDFDEVTNIDLLVENRIIELIRSIDRNAHIISEELNSDNTLCGKTWIIDPIDGTCNFTHGIRMYGIQCALYEDTAGIFSVIFFPETGEMFLASKGEGAKLNGRPIHAADRPPNRSIISFGDFIHSDPELVALEHRVMARVVPVVERIRMFGAASIDFSYAACGRIDGNFTFTDKIWDLLPGILLCQEAGLIVTDAFGNPYSMDNETVAVFSTQDLYKACIC